MDFQVPSSDKAAVGAVTGCTVAMTNMSKELQMETDESYTLDIAAGSCAITAKTYVGALRAVRRPFGSHAAVAVAAAVAAGCRRRTGRDFNC